MKFASVLATAATLALVAEGRGDYSPMFHKGNRSDYAHKRVAEVKNDMELAYGKGLVGLRDEKGRIDPKKLGRERRHLQGADDDIYEPITINGVSYNAANVETLFLGWVEGFQYKELTVGAFSKNHAITDFGQ